MTPNNKSNIFIPFLFNSMLNYPSILIYPSKTTFALFPLIDNILPMQHLDTKLPIIP